MPAPPAGSPWGEPDSGRGKGGKTGSGGKHGGGHKDRQRAGDKSVRAEIERIKQARIAQSRGQRDTSGRKGKPSGQGKGGK